jgi:Membrane-bound lysozyme-inhibitor of c-type lysozyme
MRPLSLRRLAFLGLAAAPLALAGCSDGSNGGLINLGALSGDREVRYRCDDDRSFRVSFNGDRDRATVETEDETYRLRLEDRDDDRRVYGEGDVQLTVDDDEARLRIRGRSDYTDCEA